MSKIPVSSNCTPHEKREYFCIDGKYYGNPNLILPKFKKNRRNSVIEAATKFTLNEKTPLFYMDWTFVVSLTLSTIGAEMLELYSKVFENLFVNLAARLVLVLFLEIILGLCTRPLLKAKKDRILTASRERLKDVQYFADFLKNYPDAEKLSDEQIDAVHALAVKRMDNDEALTDAVMSQCIKEAVGTDL